MLVTRRESFASAPVAASAARGRGTKHARTAESSFDQITLSARAGQETSTAFRDLAAALSHQVRTYNTTGRVQELRRQVMDGEYRPDARETAARMLLLTEGE
jgi:anti-sigma28 factor (negative regulator of flagellin synthesis)